MHNKGEEMMKILGESLHYTFDEEACVSTFDIKKTVANLIAHGVTVQEWISVKDRLPEFGKRVLILGNRKDGQFIYIDQVCADGNWLLVNWEVTHWMPLPQPPKGE